QTPRRRRHERPPHLIRLLRARGSRPWSPSRPLSVFRTPLAPESADFKAATSRSLTPAWVCSTHVLAPVSAPLTAFARAAPPRKRYLVRHPILGMPAAAPCRCTIRTELRL